MRAPLLVRRVHKWLALFVGVQALIWTATGMYMVAVHIDTIHGDHLVRSAAGEPRQLAGLMPPGALVEGRKDVREVRLQTLLGLDVWRIDSTRGAYLVDARSGAPLPPLTEGQVRAVARSIFTGEPDIVSTKLLTEAPPELQGRKPPYWRVEFKGWDRPTLYISPTTGELIGRRHNLWRIFDFAWMLHIMDYDKRTDVNNPLLRVATWSAVLMALTGGWLAYWSFPRKKKKKAA